jgi:hypothetical protein
MRGLDPRIRTEHRQLPDFSQARADPTLAHGSPDQAGNDEVGISR